MPTVDYLLLVDCEHNIFKEKMRNATEEPKGGLRRIIYVHLIIITFKITHNIKINDIFGGALYYTLTANNKKYPSINFTRQKQVNEKIVLLPRR